MEAPELQIGNPELREKLVSIMTRLPKKPSGQTRPAAGTDYAAFKARKEREEFLKSLKKAGIGKRYQDVTFESIEQRGLPENESIRGNYAAAKAYAQDIQRNVKDGNGLVFAGNYGTMKTTIAVAILRAWMETGRHGLLVPMCVLIDTLYTLKYTNREEWAAYQQRILTVPLLIIDDLGSENTDQSWVLTKIDGIITLRHGDQLPVIVTTNFTQEQLKGTYSGRVMDRLRHSCKFLVFKGKSERRPAV